MILRLLLISKQIILKREWCFLSWPCLQNKDWFSQIRQREYNQCILDTVYQQSKNKRSLEIVAFTNQEQDSNLPTVHWWPLTALSELPQRLPDKHNAREGCLTSWEHQDIPDKLSETSVMRCSWQDKETLMDSEQRRCGNELTSKENRSQQENKSSRNWSPMPTYASTKKMGVILVTPQISYVCKGVHTGKWS